LVAAFGFGVVPPVLGAEGELVVAAGHVGLVGCAAGCCPTARN